MLVPTVGMMLTVMPSRLSKSITARAWKSLGLRNMLLRYDAAVKCKPASSIGKAVTCVKIDCLPWFSTADTSA